MHFCESCGELVEMESTDEYVCLSCLYMEDKENYSELDFSEHHSSLSNEVKEEDMLEEEWEGEPSSS